MGSPASVAVTNEPGSRSWEFAEGSTREDHVKVGVLTGSLVSALLASVVLRSRNRVYRRIEQEESADTDADGIPDVYQRDA